ncbi:MAG: hypothetical protein U5N86_09510 [Planctomycetota bacterium]|nr:hypothetical protein [Planctomycetota bacterium]
MSVTCQKHMTRAGFAVLAAVILLLAGCRAHEVDPTGYNPVTHPPM